MAVKSRARIMTDGLDDPILRGNFPSYTFVPKIGMHFSRPGN